MRGVEALVLVAAPGNVEVVRLAIGTAVDAHRRGSDDFLDRSNDAMGGVDGAAGVVSIVNAAHRAVDPDLFGDADDIIDDVGEIVLEARHWLSSHARRGAEFRCVALANACDGRAFGKDEWEAVMGHCVRLRYIRNGPESR